MRWLAIHFPLLALESLAPEESGTPLAITGLQGSRQRILMCNKPAAELGVAAGMRPGAARALSARLRLLPRDERRELAALAAVADWSGCFTSQISLDPPGVFCWSWRAVCVCSAVSTRCCPSLETG